MNKNILFLGIILILFLYPVYKILGLGDKKGTPINKPHSKTESIYSLSINSIDNKTLNLSQFKNKVMIIVNVASKCGFTNQYEELQTLHETYKDKGLVILGIPSNDFGNQEPGTLKEIQSFCSLNYGITFQMTEKVHTKGPNQHPIYTFLTKKESSPYPGNIKWNFTKFIVNKKGNISHRFGSMVKPTSSKFIKAIESEISK
ncbi:glutathione peroxidase [Candidatus Marinamargulisbacteria bacterium SCGC AG-343-D04]|nr:glutathione peroxidase [Candidatus Marinamargulisbacteria bacterium SCGC AG-343-D04]